MPKANRLQFAADKCRTHDLELQKIIFAWNELPIHDQARLERAAEPFLEIRGLGALGILELFAALGMWMINDNNRSDI